MQVTEEWHGGRTRGGTDGGRGGVKRAVARMAGVVRRSIQTGGGSDWERAALQGPVDEYSCSSFHSITRTDQITHRRLIASDALMIRHDMSYKGEEQRPSPPHPNPPGNRGGHDCYLRRPATCTTMSGVTTAGRSRLSGGARTQCKSDKQE